MRTLILAAIIVLSSILSYGQSAGGKFINPRGGSLKDRVNCLAGYTRVAEKQGTFAEYLRNLRLKPDGTPVHYYNGKEKANSGIYVAVVDMPIGNKDLQQCADVVMHVRAEYLYRHHLEDKIHFTFTSGFKAEYGKWKEGYRISVKGNNVKWVKTASPDNSQKTFDAFMDVVYTYCGTLSLSKELKNKPFAEIMPGDVLIKGGSPGHAELVLDVAVNKVGEKIFLLSQSYMPAQEMQVLTNPESRDLSPWYAVKSNGTVVITPEWTFEKTQLMRFEDNY